MYRSYGSQLAGISINGLKSVATISNQAYGSFKDSAAVLLCDKYHYPSIFVNGIRISEGLGRDKEWVNVEIKIKVDPLEMNGLMLKVIVICPDKVLYFDHIQVIAIIIQ